MRIQRSVLVAAILGIFMVTAVRSMTLPGRIRVDAEKGTQLRIRASGDNVTLVSAARIYGRDSVSVDILAPAEFAIKPHSRYYVRFDAADSTTTINVSARGGLAFGFVKVGSRYRGVSVVCGSPGESQVHPLPLGTSLADRSCPE